MIDVRSFSSVYVQQLRNKLSEIQGISCGQSPVATLEYVGGELLVVLACEWAVKSSQFVEEHAQRPDVRLEPMLVPLHHLRRIDLGCTHHKLFFGTDDLGKSAMSHLDYSVVQECVLSLDIGVCNIPVMDLLETKTGLYKPAHNQTLFELSLLVFLHSDVLRQILSVCLLHHHADLVPSHLLDVLALNRVGVLQHLYRFEFSQHSSGFLLIKVAHVQFFYHYFLSFLILTQLSFALCSLAQYFHLVLILAPISSYHFLVKYNILED